MSRLFKINAKVSELATLENTRIEGMTRQELEERLEYMKQLKLEIWDLAKEG